MVIASTALSMGSLQPITREAKLSAKNSTSGKKENSYHKLIKQQLSKDHCFSVLLLFSFVVNRSPEAEMGLRLVWKMLWSKYTGYKNSYLIFNVQSVYQLLPRQYIFVLIVDSKLIHDVEGYHELAQIIRE